MKEWKEYVIPFSGLKAGKHEFSFKLNKEFLDTFNYTDIDDTACDVALTLDKKSNMLVFDSEITGWISCPCDRCADPVQVDIHGNNTLYVKFSDEDKEGTDEITYIKPEAYEFQIAPYLYEYLVTSIPHKRVHDEGNCNEEVIAKLEKLSSDQNKIDPRWGKLKDLNLEL